MKKSFTFSIIKSVARSVAVALVFFVPSHVEADDGSGLWLKLPPDGKGRVVTDIRRSPTVDIIVEELEKYWTGEPVRLELRKDRKLGDEGFVIRRPEGKPVISSSSEKGLLYGAYHLLRLRATGESLRDGEIVELPQYSRRILNHWDNPDGTIERGYAGRSIWEWDSLPGKVSPRYREYARANASVGINGTVLNNVNAKAEILTGEYLVKIKEIADVLRPYGMRVYLSINFDSPKKIGNLPTSDPLDKDVVRWWKGKIKEIYGYVPDFGGFLVKANSEGTAGPLDYGRTHADGANMLAGILAPYGGIVMWRAFVYNPEEADRAKQAYDEFKPLDGKFRDNVIIQVKNGPVDFQPREPYTPLFGAMHSTRLMAEFQITQEYLGHANHLAYLAPMWEEFFEYVDPSSISAVAGVSNIGSDVNWCGHDMAQSNWYAFGRLAWNPRLTSGDIAEEWLKQTFTTAPEFVDTVKQMMLESREAVVNYMMPLGLHHIFAGNHHYGPQPWYFMPDMRVDWTATHYHKADSEGLGFNRSSTGTDAVSQYPDELAALFDDINTCPDEFLLWFHHVPWKHRMKNGRIFWDELCHRYDEGVRQVREFQKTWDRIEPYVDKERFSRIQDKLKIQARDAVWWKDACLLYFQEFSSLPIPYDIERPVHSLEDMKAFELKIGLYDNAPHGFNK